MTRENVRWFDDGRFEEGWVDLNLAREKFECPWKESEALYLSRDGFWVLQDSNILTFLTVEGARGWLVEADLYDAVKKYFPQLDEVGPQWAQQPE